MLWTEKYRPKKVNEIIGQDSFVENAKNWILINDVPHLILYGPAGTGKTSAGLALSKEILKEDFSFNFLELNASDDRKLETVRTTIKDFASSAKLGNCPFKICLLDEMDGMTSDAQNAFKRIMEKYSKNVRFIITCNDKSKIIYPIQSRCATYMFNKLTDEHIFMVLNKILKVEKGEEVEPIPIVPNTFNGDLRKAITQMQAGFKTDANQVEYSQYKEIIDDSISEKCVLDKLQELYSNGISVKDICNGLHEVILNEEYDRKMKYKYLRIIGETEYRSSNMTPKIIMSWMATQMK